MSQESVLKFIQDSKLKIFTCLFWCLFLTLPASAAQRRTPVVAAVESAGAAVVNIRTEQIVQRRSSSFFGFGGSLFDEFFRDFGPQRVYRTQSLGSGVLIDPRGYVLTNAHVIEKASKIYVALPGRTKEVEATLVGADEHIDLAVVRLEGEWQLPHLEFASLWDLMLGETVIAIGNPLGLGHSVTTGVVSSPRRRLAIEDGFFGVFIQTDALINPGNSGGPLININGELIGINTAIASQAQGIGFSIPGNVAQRVAADLIGYGRVRPAFIGLVPGAVSRAMVQARGGGGVLVTEVEGGSPAAEAGIEVADVILAIDGVAVESQGEFFDLLSTYTPDDQVKIRLLRGIEELERPLRLASLPQGYGFAYGKRNFGLVVAEGGDAAVVRQVVPGSPAQKAGILPGDLVAEIGGQQVADVDAYRLLMEENIGRFPLRFLIVRGNRGYYLSLP